MFSIQDYEAFHVSAVQVVGDDSFTIQVYQSKGIIRIDGKLCADGKVILSSVGE